MFSKLKIGTNVKLRMAATEPIEGTVCGIEREHSNDVVALLVATPGGNTRWVDLTTELCLGVTENKTYLN